MPWENYQSLLKDQMLMRLEHLSKSTSTSLDLGGIRALSNNFLYAS